MANYDMSIRVNTDIDTSQMKRLQIQIDKAAYKVETLAAKYEEVKNKRIPTEAYQEASKQIETAEGKLAKLVARQEEMIETGRNSGTAWESLQYKIDEIRNFIKYAKWDLQDLVDTGEDFTIGGSPEEIAEAGHELAVARAELDALITKKEEMQAVNLKPQEWAAGFSQAAKSGKKLFSVIQKGSKKSNGLLSTMSSRLKGLALSLLVFNWISKGFNALVSSMREGFKNLAKYSGEYNASMSALKSECAQLKNGLAAAFEPVVTAVIPYITQLVSWLNVAADAMARFLAALSGKSSYTRAKKQVIDYAKSLDTASKAAKGALAAFDDINVLQKNDSGNRGAGGELVGADAFETADVGADMQAVVSALQPFRDAIDGWLANLDFTSAIVAFDELKESCAPFAGYLYDGMLWFLNNVLLPIGKWTIEDAVPAFLSMVAEGLSTLDDVITVLQPSLEYFWDNVLSPMGEFTGEALIWALEEIKDTFSDLSNVFTEHGEGINNILGAVGKAIEFLWECVAKPTLQFLKGGIGTLFDYLSRILGDVIDVLSGIVDFISGVFTLNWEKAWNGIVDIFKGIINFIIDIYEGIVNTIITGLNMISIDVPDWVPGIGGKTFGFNLEKLNIPRLATGGITNRPTIAQIGEAGREAVLPLENNTEWMDVLADKITANIPAGNGGPVYLQVDGQTFARLCLPYLDKEKARIGVSFRVT